ncbi:hypothetical protein GCM10025790_00070 [Nesterenkonia rhizosphaerae]|uniref:Alpha/beta hydrolase n=2 Tax=Nesterenkonia rhizosphaerae TaxID=1348272 RepID=A0ABP9FUW2_9MICC
MTLRDWPGHRLTFHRAEKASDTLLITFDSITSDISSSGFGTDFAARMGYDHIFVAQRKKSQYQDLSLADFEEIVKPYSSHYKRVFTYGASLGGYAAVYFGGVINAQIVAVSPHNSAHPLIRRNNFRHLPFSHKEIVDNPVSARPPIIIYDPKLPDDQSFIDELILPAYPHARLVQVPYASHNVLASLRLSGELSRFIKNILEKDEISPVRLRTEGNYIWHAQYGQDLSKHKGQVAEGERHLWRSLNLRFTKDAVRPLAHLLFQQGRHEELRALEMNAERQLAKKGKKPWWVPFPETWLTGAPETVASAGTYKRYDHVNPKERIPPGGSLTLASQPGYRITLRRAEHPSRLLLICFGTVSSGLASTGFGSVFADKQGYDYLYVAQRKQSQYQELSLEAFRAAVLPYTRGYDRVVTYGGSLGGYAATYYGGSVNASIVASAPKNSAHSIISRSKHQNLIFTHRPVTEVPVSQHTPVIIFDPKREEDVTFIDGVIRPAYPHGNYVEIPYSGHAVLHTLQVYGVLKDFIVPIIEENTVPYVQLPTEGSYIWHGERGREHLLNNEYEDAETELRKSLVAFYHRNAVSTLARLYTKTADLDSLSKLLDEAESHLGDRTPYAVFKALKDDPRVSVLLT